MQKNQMILLVVVLVIVVVAIIAVVLMMGGGGGGGMPIAGEDLVGAIMQGKPVECDFTVDLAKVAASSGQAMGMGMAGTMTGKYRIENPKMRASGTMSMQMSGISMDIDMDMRTDGSVIYMQMAGMPGMGDTWFKIDSPQDAMGMQADPNQIANQLNNMPDGVSLSCRLVGDIPDSEFQLPPGVVAQDLSGLMGGYTGGYNY